MHKLVLDFIKFLRNSLEFIKILDVFLLAIFIFYWIQNIVNFPLGWLKCFYQLFDFMIDLGSYINNKSIVIFSEAIELKYIVVIGLFLLFYALICFAQKSLDIAKDFYCTTRSVVKKIEEKSLNKSFDNKNSHEQKKIKRFQIYVETQIKNDALAKGIQVNLEEQNKTMNKFLVEKFSICPQSYKNGFLYTFETFGEIDNILDIFNKLILSKAPIDFVICVQIITNDSKKDDMQLKNLIKLRFLNKIVTSSDTVYRYGFNEVCRYEFSQLGIFQKEEGTFEAHEFVKKD